MITGVQGKIISPLSWLHVLFFVTNLLPNILFQLSAHEFLMLVFLALPCCPNLHSPVWRFVNRSSDIHVPIQLPGRLAALPKLRVASCQVCFPEFDSVDRMGVLLGETGVSFCTQGRARIRVFPPPFPPRGSPLL